MTALTQELVINEIFWIDTSYEKDRDYIYQGMRGEEHVFIRDGAIKNNMRLTLVRPEFIRIEGKRVTIVDDNYRVGGISKEENLEEYNRLQTLWRSKTQ